MSLSLDLDELPEDVRRNVQERAAGYDGGLDRTVGPGVGGGPKTKTEDEADLDAVIDEVERLFTGDLEEIAGKTDPADLHSSRTPTYGNQIPGVHLAKGELPGFRTKGDTCGDPFPLICDHCGAVTMVGETCSSYGCKRCAPRNIRDAVESHTARMKAAAKWGQTQAHGDVFYHHLVISLAKIGWRVDSDLADGPEEAMKKTKDLIKEIVQELGLRGGYIYYHAYRSDDDEDYQDEIESLDNFVGDAPKDDAADDRGFWKDVLFQGRDWTGDVEDELSFEPHYHVIGVSEFVEGGELTKRLEEETGIVAHRITQGEDSNVSIFDDMDLARATAYAASHTYIYDSNRGTELAAWPFGRDVWGRSFYGGDNPIYVSEDVEAEMRKKVREVAPDVLDLPYESMICQEEPEEPADISLELADAALDPDRDQSSSGGSSGGSGGGNPWGSSGRTAALPADHSGDLPSRRRGDLPVKAPRDRGEFQDVDETWRVPTPSVPDVTDGRLEALRRAEPHELIHEFEGVSRKNVWTFKNKLQEASPNAEICGGSLRNPYDIKDRLNSDDWRRNARYSGEAVETLARWPEEFDFIEWEGSGPDRAR